MIIVCIKKSHESYKMNAFYGFNPYLLIDNESKDNYHIFPSFKSAGKLTNSDIVIAGQC